MYIFFPQSSPFSVYGRLYHFYLQSLPYAPPPFFFNPPSLSLPVFSSKPSVSKMRIATFLSVERMYDWVVMQILNMFLTPYRQ